MPAKEEGFRNILIHTSGKNLGGDLSPYVLKNESGQLLENVWQFAKVWERVFEQRIPLGRFHPNRIVWEWPAEVHLFNDKITAEYWNWRKQGMDNKYAVRYPNGFKNRTKTLFSLWPNANNEFERLDYIQARKAIYCAEYARLAPKTPHFAKLKDMLERGINLQIVEVDGPDPSLDFEPYNRITPEQPGLDIDKETIQMLLNDERRAFGHGYTIAALLLDGSEWLK